MQMLLPAVQHLTTDDKEVVLFLDGHASHLSLDLIHLAKSNNVHLFCLPPHCTHVLQPFDVGVYGPVKKQWRTILKDHKTTTMAENDSKEVFTSKLYQIAIWQYCYIIITGLIKTLWEASFKVEHIKAGFRASGLHPFNKDAIPKSKLAPSKVFAQPEDLPAGLETTTTSADVPVTTTSADVPVTTTSADVPVTTTSADVPVTTTSADVPVTTTSADVPVTTTSADVPVTTTRA